jgi:hypothetical protein
MIEYINKRMIDWATWCKRRDDGGLGYPGSTSYCNLVQIHGDRGAGPVADGAAALEIEGVIVDIRKTAPAQYDVAFWFYLAGSMTVKRIAHELKCSEVTVYNRLHALHLVVMHALQDIDIAAQDRAAIERARPQIVA